MKQDYKKTTYACFIGYIVQAIVNSFVPLLFVTFQKTYQIPLTKITLLITINFVIQLLIDLLSAGFIDKIRLPGICDYCTYLCGGRAGTAHGFAGTFSQIRLLAF